MTTDRPWRLLLLLAGSEALYLALLPLDAVTGAAPVARFLGIMAGLFLLYALAFRELDRLPRGPGVFAAVLGAGLLFRQDQAEGRQEDRTARSARQREMYCWRGSAPSGPPQPGPGR